MDRRHPRNIHAPWITMLRALTLAAFMAAAAPALPQAGGAQAQMTRGDAAMKAKDYVQALDANSASELGFAYNSLKQYAEAAAAYEQALQANPENVIALRRLGSTYLAMGRKPDAVQIANKLQNIDKDRAQSLNAEIGKSK